MKQLVQDEVTLIAEYPVSQWKDSQGKLQTHESRVRGCTLDTKLKQQAVDIAVKLHYDEDIRFLALGGYSLGLTGYYEPTGREVVFIQCHVGKKETRQCARRPELQQHLHLRRDWRQ